MTKTIYLADTYTLSNPQLFETAYRTVSPTRRAKIDAVRFDKDKRLSLGAGLLLHIGLTECGLKAPFDIDYNEFGKPFLANNDGIFFSLSHSGTRAMCAISDVPVGCDIEIVKEADLKVAKRFFHPDEYEAILALATPESAADFFTEIASTAETTKVSTHATVSAAQSDMFFRIWTRKESYVKAVGKGLSLPFESFSVLDDEGENYLIRSISYDSSSRSNSPEGITSKQSESGCCPPIYHAAVCELNSAATLNAEMYELRIIDFEQTELLK